MVGLIWVNLFAVLKKTTTLFYGSVGTTRCQQKKQYAYIVNTDLLVQLTIKAEIKPIKHCEICAMFVT